MLYLASITHVYICKNVFTDQLCQKETNICSSRIKEAFLSEQYCGSIKSSIFMKYEINKMKIHLQLFIFITFPIHTMIYCSNYPAYIYFLWSRPQMSAPNTICFYKLTCLVTCVVLECKQCPEENLWRRASYRFEICLSRPLLLSASHREMYERLNRNVCLFDLLWYGLEFLSGKQRIQKIVSQVL